MRLLVRGGDEEFRLEALADQPALHVDEAGEHGVDLARGDGFLQLVEGQVPGHERESSLEGSCRPARACSRTGGIVSPLVRRDYMVAAPSRCFTANSSSGE